VKKNAEKNGNKTSQLFKKRSIFWNLPYWKDLMVHHAIDVMYVEKNVCDALVGTLLDIPGKTKDTLNAWMDLEKMKLIKDLRHKTLENGQSDIQMAYAPKAWEIGELMVDEKHFDNNTQTRIFHQWYLQQVKIGR
jgi:hypothetical protein